MSTADNSLVNLIDAAAQAAVQRSLNQTIVPIIRHGTLIEANISPGIHEVQMDGDNASIACHDITTGFGIPIGARVTVLFAPPHQAFIIGAVTRLGPIRQYIGSSSSSTYSVSTATDMALTDVPVIAGRTYAVHLHSLVEFASLAAAARWLIHFRVEGAQIDRFWDLHPNLTGTMHFMIDAICYWTPDITGDFDIDVYAENNVGGATVQFQANGTNVFRKLTVHDKGILPSF